jgi:short subunit fatty acids transporter
MPQTHQGNLSTRFVGGAAGVGALTGWRVAANEALPHVICSHFARASTQIAHCFNRSLIAEVIHWGLPMLVGFIMAGAVATGVVVILRGFRARTA